MPELKGTKTHDNLKEAFAGESQANRRYLYFAQKADVEGEPDIAALFRSVAEGETGHAFGHFDFLAEVGDPATGEAVGGTAENLKSAIAGETYEYTQMYPGFAKTAREEGFEDIAEWLETLAARRDEPRGPVHRGSQEAAGRLRRRGSRRAAPGPTPGAVATRRDTRVVDASMEASTTRDTTCPDAPAKGVRCPCTTRKSRHISTTATRTPSATARSTSAATAACA